MNRYSWPYVVFFLMIGFVTLAPQIAPHDPMRSYQPALQPPGLNHLLGTDALGRDVASRLLYGGRHTLFVAALASALAISCGVCLGILWGLVPRQLNTYLTICMSSILALPGLITAIVLLTLLGRGTMQITLAIGLSQIAYVAQIIRGATVSVRDAPYIESAHAIGATNFHIIRRYIVPNIWPTILVYTGVVFGYSILNSAALTFLGLGELGVPDWGVMLAEGRAVFDEAPWVSVFPGLAITSIVFAVNAMSDRLM